MTEPRNLRGTWSQALLTFFLPLLLLVGVRWLLFEPFVIPSGSMIPTLLIHDHILVNKLRYGIKVPFGNSFLLQWGHPHRGEIVVFRYPKNPEVFFVKRVAAIAGDTLEVKDGTLFINGKKVDQDVISREATIKNIQQETGFDYFQEHDLDFQSEDTHVVRYENHAFSTFHSVTVPEGQFFAMGDNRDQSADSRFWGYVPEQNLIGSTRFVWLSCEKTLESAAFLCDPQTVRWNRMGLKVH